MRTLATHPILMASRHRSSRLVILPADGSRHGILPSFFSRVCCAPKYIDFFLSSHLRTHSSRHGISPSFVRGFSVSLSSSFATSSRHCQHLDSIRSSWHPAKVLLVRGGRVPAVINVRTAFFSSLSHPITNATSTVTVRRPRTRDHTPNVSTAS